MNVGFLAGAYLRAARIDRISLEMCVHREVVKAAVGEAISVIWEREQLSMVIRKDLSGDHWLTVDVLHSGDEIDFGEIGDTSMDGAAAAKTRYLDYQRGGNNLVVPATRFNL